MYQCFALALSTEVNVNSSSVELLNTSWARQNMVNVTVYTETPMFRGSSQGAKRSHAATPIKKVSYADKRVSIS